MLQSEILGGISYCYCSSISSSNFMSNSFSKSQFGQLPVVNTIRSPPSIRCQSKTLVLLSRSSSKKFTRKKKYGGMLPSILRSLESSGDDIDNVLHSCWENLSPKEQTVILKEQRSWDRVLKVFAWFKSKKEYMPNVIHFNVVLRALGKAQKWDELRSCWIEMARTRVLPTNNTYSMLVDVFGEAGLVKEAILWIEHMRMRGLFPDEVTMNTVVRVLKNAGEFDRADRFFKGWCDGHVDVNQLELDTLSDSSKMSRSSAINFEHLLSIEFRTGRRIPVSNAVGSRNTDISSRTPQLTSTFNNLIDLYGKAGRLKDAADIFAAMVNSGVALDTTTFNAMIYICGKQGDMLEAEGWLSKMHGRGISPDTKTYNIFLSLYANAGNIDAAMSCYRKIREVGLFPDVVTHRALINVLCERNMVQDVEFVMEEMKKLGVMIDEHSIPSIVKMYVKKGLLDHAKNIFKNCKVNDGPSSKICAAIIDVFAEKGLWAEAETVFFREQGSVGQTKDVAEYNVMIKAYGSAKLPEKALSLLKEMKNYGTCPDECTYNSLIQMLSGSNMIDQAKELFAEMQAIGFKPHRVTFSAIIGCYARLGQLSDAVNMYEEMSKTGIKPNEVVYGSLINGFAEHGRVEEALQFYYRMEESGISPNKIILTSLIKAYAKVGSLDEAKAVYERMKDSEGGADVIASNSMINLYAELGMVSEAKLIFESLRQRGWSDGISYATMMYLYKNLGRLDEVIEVAEEMKQSGFLKDCVSYNKVMDCYVSNRQLRKCGELMHEMLQRKISPDSRTFKVLFTALKKGGFNIKAVSQLESSYKEGKPYAEQAAITALYSVVGMHSLALESCERFIDPDLVLDCFAYNVAIFAYGAAGDIDEALDVFKKMQDLGVQPDLVTHINLVACYGRACMIEGVKRIFGEVKYEEMQPSEPLFKAIIDSYWIANGNDIDKLVSQQVTLDTEVKSIESDSDL